MVGPFAFIDQVGPALLHDNENLDIGMHPHIGLSTLTYLFEGNIMHRDSLGSEVEINPGEVNWMTAGGGITHSESTPERLRHTDKMLHGLQIWVALPKSMETIAPSFVHIEEHELPSWTIDTVQARLIAGEAFGRKSAVPVYSPLYLIELKSSVKQELAIGSELYGESGIYILEGSIESDGTTFMPKQLLVAKDASLCTFTMNANTTVYIFGGEPFPEERFIYWNFVATSREMIEEAKTRWINQDFPKVTGETDYVPLPEQPANFRPKV